MYTRRRSWKRKAKRRPWALIALLLLIGVPIGLELLARLIANMTGVSEQLTAAQPSKTEIVQAYRLGFLNASAQPYPELPPGNLLAVRNPLMGYQLLPQQKNKYWTINPQGFRDEAPVPLEKPAGEVRIFVLGDSMAFGQLSSSDRTTFSSALERLLNEQVAGQKTKSDRFQPAVLPYRADQVGQALALPPRIPDKQYRVINAAVPGYTAGNELAMLMQQVASYNPDIVLILTSSSDLMLPSSQSGADIPGLDDVLKGKQQDFGKQVKESIQNWFNQMYLVKGVQHYVLQSPPPEEEMLVPLNITTAKSDQPLDASLTADPAELTRRVTRYRNHLSQIVQWSSAARKPLFVGIQPDITSRAADAMPPEETAIVSKLGSHYAERVQLGYSKLAEAATQATKPSANSRVLDLHQLYAKTTGQVFQSPLSLTDEANAVLAQNFYQAIVNKLAIEPKPFGS
jgi:hypothetical protein